MTWAAFFPLGCEITPIIADFLEKSSPCALRGRWEVKQPVPQVVPAGATRPQVQGAPIEVCAGGVKSPGSFIEGVRSCTDSQSVQLGAQIYPSRQEPPMAVARWTRLGAQSYADAKKRRDTVCLSSFFWKRQA